MLDLMKLRLWKVAIFPNCFDVLTIIYLLIQEEYGQINQWWKWMVGCSPKLHSSKRYKQPTVKRAKVRGHCTSDSIHVMLIEIWKKRLEDKLCKCHHVYDQIPLYELKIWFMNWTCWTFLLLFSLQTNACWSKDFPSPELVELSFNWPRLWLSSCPLFCYISLIYSVQDRVRDRVPDCLYFPQRLIVVRQYSAR